MISAKTGTGSCITSQANNFWAFSRPMFHLYSKNKLHELAGRFLAARREHREHFLSDDLLAAECVIVQTRGMATYLQQYWLRAGEVVCNTRFPFLNHHLEELLRQQLPAGRYQPQWFTPEVMVWRILELLPETAKRFERLARYLAAGDDRELRRYQLALRIARVFDQYQIYRPDLLQRWMTDGVSPAADEAWQRDLWQKLRQGGKLAGRGEMLFDFIRQNEVKPGPPVSVFGVSTMPPFFLKALKKYSLVNEVNFFYLNPCAEYWAEHPMRRDKHLRDCPDQDWEFVNPLLSAFGLPGRNFFREILELDHDIDEEMDLYLESADPAVGPSTLLSEVQSRVIAVAGGPLTKRHDDSITFHNCPGKMREIEILHDKLLYLLRQKHYTLNDIMVMAPDINEFVPLIQSVFDRGPLRESYSICDRTVRSTNLAAAAFLKLLAMRQGRFEVTQIWELLDSPELRQKFAFDEAAMELVRSLLINSSIRWGTDQKMRLELFGVEFAEYSWRQGLDRLLHGLAIDDDPAAAVNGTVPLNLITSTDGMVVLGNLCLFFDRLADWCGRVPEAAAPPVWQELLAQLLADFFAPEAAAPGDYTLLATALKNFFETVNASGFAGELRYEVLINALTGLTEAPAAAQPFLNGKISFSSLTPMRSVPAKVIVLLGMDEGVFPRLERKVEFDLTPADASYVYRSREWQDRYLFLESLLSARDYLLIFYSGISTTDRSRFAPSAVVSELLDYLAGSGGELPVKEYVLQGFDADNFGCRAPASLLDDFSFSPEYFRMLTTLDMPGKAAGFADNLELLPPVEPEEREFDLIELERYFINPARYFLVNRLHFKGYLAEDELLSDLEPLAVSRRDVGNFLTQIGKCDGDEAKLAQLRQRLAGQNKLPPAALGELAFGLLRRQAVIGDDDLRRRWLSQSPQWLTLKLPHGVLSGSLLCNDDLSGIVDCCFRPLEGAVLIRFLLRHLLLTAATNVAATSRIRGRDDDEILTLSGITPMQATAKLDELLALFCRGKNEVLPIFARASVAQALGRPPGAVKGQFDKDRQYDDYIPTLFAADWLLDDEHFGQFQNAAMLCFGCLRGGGA